MQAGDVRAFVTGVLASSSRPPVDATPYMRLLWQQTSPLGQRLQGIVDSLFCSLLNRNLKPLLYLAPRARRFPRERV